MRTIYVSLGCMGILALIPVVLRIRSWINSIIFLSDDPPSQLDRMMQPLRELTIRMVVDADFQPTEEEVYEVLEIVRHLNAHRHFSPPLPDYVLADTQAFRKEWLMPCVERMRQRHKEA